VQLLSLTYTFDGRLCRDCWAPCSGKKKEKLSPPLIFTGVKNCDFWPCRWPVLDFDLPYPSPYFYRGQKVQFLALSLTNARLWAAVVWKPRKISSTFLNSVCSDYLTMFPPSLVQIGPDVFKIAPAVLEHPLKRTKNLSLIVNNSAAEWSISLKFGKYIDHMIPDLPQKFKVKGSKVKVTAWRNVGQNLSNCE